MPKNLNIRPTTDFAKESLFNIINNRIEGYEDLEILDLYSGTGSISYEFISRGAKNVTAVEKNFKCVTYIKKQIEVLDMPNLKTVKMSATDFLEICHKSFDIIFADPPYDVKNIDAIIDLVKKSHILKENGFFVLEHAAQHNFSLYEGFMESRSYGSVNFSFFKF